MLRAPSQSRPAPVGGIDIQIHLEDQRSIATLRRLLRVTLRRAAATWAPMVLPVHRIVVGAGFPAEGKADIYERFSAAVGDQGDNRLVVISLGLRSGDRDLAPFELAGALAAQIQRVIDDVHRDHARVLADTSAPPSTNSRLAPAPAVKLADPTPAATRTNGSATGVGETGLPRLQDMIATLQEGQPLVAAGPNSHSANP